MILDCVILEDEAPALQVIESYIAKTPFLNLKGSFRRPMEALEFVTTHQPVLLFLDINMPDLNGMEFVESLPYPPYVIFVTAYPEFAVRSFEYKTVDYLLKPVRFDRFMKAAIKAKDFVSGGRRAALPEVTPVASLYLHNGGETHQINPDELVYVESSRNYVIYHVGDREIMIRQTLQEALEGLPSQFFVRTHKSFFINLRRLSKLQYDGAVLGSVTVPVGRAYREALQQRLKNQ